MELSLHDSEFASFDPSYLAASSLCLSFKLLEGPQWVFDYLYESLIMTQFSTLLTYKLLNQLKIHLVIE